jgi:4-carboxymuconolactone decarboxylase
MNRNIFLKWILLFVLIINMKTMNAQDSIPASQTLNAQQQSIVSISALTAVGDLEHLKTTIKYWA